MWRSARGGEHSFTEVGVAASPSNASTCTRISGCLSRHNQGTAGRANDWHASPVFLSHPSLNPYGKLLIPAAANSG